MRSKMTNTVKSFLTLSLTIMISPAVFADPFDWQVSVVCDAVEREARVEMVSCDYEVGCDPKELQSFGDGSSMMVGTDAGRKLYTSRHDGMTFIGNTPQEYGCSFPYQETPQVSLKDPSVFISVERFPSNWNVQGRCGAAPNQVKVSIQTHSQVLDMTRPVEIISMAGDCGWGEDGPISQVIVNADSGKITTVKYPTNGGG